MRSKYRDMIDMSRNIFEKKKYERDKWKTKFEYKLIVIGIMYII